MEIKQHIKGVLLAIVSATLILFIISFFVGSEIRVSKSYVINTSPDSVYSYIKSPKNFKTIVSGTEEFQIELLKNNEGVQYEGFDLNLHTFKYRSFDNILGLELTYVREGEAQAVFKYKISPRENASILEYEKIWRIGSNPLVKIFSLSMDEDIEEGMKNDVVKLKNALE
ncbi:MAG: hypothetical protein CMP67_06830 [Flavobacteriales bacterium]|nr:hypothetical protein [Flavobacteriales bacterium]|tara:strand:+ start:738 stop:1247 length:510 start_codon:yes stop_codon:yes gene_type:complete